MAPSPSGSRHKCRFSLPVVPGVFIALALVAGEAVFHLYAGVLVIDGNRLRFKLRDWRTMVAVKILRAKLREAMAKSLRNPGRDLGDRPRRWMSILEGIFERLKPAAPASQVR